MSENLEKPDQNSELLKESRLFVGSDQAQEVSDDRQKAPLCSCLPCDCGAVHGGGTAV